MAASVAPASIRRARGAALSTVAGFLAVAGLLTVAGAVLTASSASAAVDISPTQGVQGGTAYITFRVENLRPKAFTTKVEVGLPADQPIAEVSPLSHPDWIPHLLQRPAPAVLGKIQTGTSPDVVAGVVWTRAADAPAAPPVENLELSLGPLPFTSTFEFSVTQTYSDGTVQHWQGPASTAAASPSTGSGTVLTLSAPASDELADAPPEAGLEPVTQTVSVAVDDQAPQGGGRSGLVVVLQSLGAVLLLVSLAGLARLVREARRRAPDAGPAQ